MNENGKAQTEDDNGIENETDPEKYYEKEN